MYNISIMLDPIHLSNHSGASSSEKEMLDISSMCVKTVSKRRTSATRLCWLQLFAEGLTSPTGTKTEAAVTADLTLYVDLKLRERVT